MMSVSPLNLGKFTDQSCDAAKAEIDQVTTKATAQKVAASFFDLDFNILKTSF
jgi:hypothetical protein